MVYKWVMENLFALLALLGGSTGSGLLTYWLTLKRAKREWYITDKEDIVAFLNKQLDAAKAQLDATMKGIDAKIENERIDCDRKLRITREENDEAVRKLKKEQADMQDMLTQLRAQLTLMRKTTYDLPMASWERSPAGRILSVNPTALRTVFAPLGMGRAEVIGKSYQEIWGAPTADVLTRLEHAAITSPGRFAVHVGFRLHPTLPTCMICKYIVYPDSQDEMLLYVTYVLPLQSDELRDHLDAEHGAAGKAPA